MDNLAELDFNLTNGEFSTDSVKLVYDNVEYAVKGIFSDGYARKQVDGRFTTDTPLRTKAFTVARNAIPSNIPIDDLRLVQIKVSTTEVYAVRYVTGTDFFTFTLRPIDIVEDESEEETDSNSNQSDNSSPISEVVR